MNVNDEHGGFRSVFNMMTGRVLSLLPYLISPRCFSLCHINECVSHCDRHSLTLKVLFDSLKLFFIELLT